MFADARSAWEVTSMSRRQADLERQRVRHVPATHQCVVGEFPSFHDLKAGDHDSSVLTRAKGFIGLGGCTQVNVEQLRHHRVLDTIASMVWMRASMSSTSTRQTSRTPGG
jgi:hypothetical protein